MTNRREFLRTGVSVSVLPLVTHGLLSPAAASALSEDIRASHAVLHQAIFDDRYAEGRSFAEAIGAVGVRARALRDGDVTDPYQELDLLWRERPAAIAGLTQFGPMFVLERLGRERGLRVALRIEHRVQADGTLAHVMSGAPDTLSLAETLRRHGVDWPVLIAALATRCRSGRPARAARTITTPGGKPVLARAPAAPGSADAPESVIHYYRQFAIQEGRDIPWDGPLFSWVIAPAARA